jgi:hypothetical protein
MSTPDAYAAERRRRVLTRFWGRLGGRVALLGALPAPRRARPLLRCAAVVPCDVLGRLVALPVASGSLTGLAAALPLDGGAGAALRECARVLQPGCHALALGELQDATAFEEAARSVGLEPVLRTPVGPLPARARLPEGLWGVDAALDRLAVRVASGGEAPAEAAVLLRREGGDRVEIPGLGALLRQSVWPGGVRR